jgi:hypothetical protein
MKQVAIAKARDHLDLAKKAVERLNLDGGFKPYEQAWSEIVSQLSRFYSKLEQGAKGCKTSEPWMGRKKSERKSDPLMSYLHHARNSDEHGIDYITQRGADAMTMKFPSTNEVRVGFEMMIDDSGAMHIRNPTVESPNGGVDTIEVLNPRVELVAVKDRNVIYHPPQMHADRPVVDRSPVGCAHLAIAYLESVLEEASKLPVH